MSVEALQWAQSLALLAPEKGVLKTLAWHSNKQNGECFPSQATIAFEEGISEATVKNCIARLKALGLVKVVDGGRGRDGKRGVNRYLLAMDKTVTAAEAKAAHGLRATAKAPRLNSQSEARSATRSLPDRAGASSRELRGSYGHEGGRSNVGANPEQPSDAARATWCEQQEPRGSQERKREREGQSDLAKNDGSGDGGDMVAVAHPSSVSDSSTPPDRDDECWLSAETWPVEASGFPKIAPPGSSKEVLDAHHGALAHWHKNRERDTGSASGGGFRGVITAGSLGAARAQREASRTASVPAEVDEKQEASPKGPLSSLLHPPQAPRKLFCEMSPDEIEAAHAADRKMFEGFLADFHTDPAPDATGL